ncbi:hypothetical protein K1T71_012011 [Dendrolimus kikuchii]|uniref:Uncharacterized protein n=1 Tax=Dendrolimus kikuchii TaxID=765133 RepID=A0ACC1CKC2_9NEOP|nr:hypothetical protein K1T71_012011 [Dendrolimus kikuchii]
MSSTLNIGDNIELITLKARQDSLFEVLQLIYKKSLQAFDSTECLHCFLTYAATLDNIRTQFKNTVNTYNEELLMTVLGAIPDFDAMIPFEELYCKTKAALRRLQSKNTVLDCNHIQYNYKTALQSLAVVSNTPILQSSTHSDALCSPQSFVINDDLPQKSIPLSPNNLHIDSYRNDEVSPSMASCSLDVKKRRHIASYSPASTLAVSSKSLQSLTQSDASRLSQFSTSKPDLSHKNVSPPLINACRNDNISTSMSYYSHDVENYIQTASYSDTSTLAVLSKSLSSSALSASDGDHPSQLWATNTIPTSRNVTKPHNKSYVDSIRVCMNSEILPSITVNSDIDEDGRVNRTNKQTYSHATLTPSVVRVAIDGSLLKLVSSGRFGTRHCLFKSNDDELPQNITPINGKYNMSFEDIADDMGGSTYYET